MTDTPRDRVLEALSGRAPDKVPVAVFSQSATLSQMDSSGAPWPLAHSDPVAMAKLGSEQARRFGFESVRAPFCMTAEAERLGCTVDLGRRDKAPMVVGHPYESDPMSGVFPEVPDVDPDDYIGGGRTAVTVEAAGIMSREQDGENPVVIGAVGPLTLVGQVLGAEAMVMATLMCPDKLSRWTDMADRLQAEYLKALSDAGADAIFLTDGSASPNMVDPSMYWEIAGSRTTCLKAPGCRTVLHICGSSMQLVPDMLRTGADALSLESTVDPYRLREMTRGRAALIGAVGPVEPLLMGTPEQVSADARMYAEADFDVVTPGCGISILTPDRNMAALRNFSGKP